MNPSSYGCAPLEPAYINTNNWRNLAVEDIVKKYKLKNIIIIPWYEFTRDLWYLHPNGGHLDCTHFCNTPMLYMPIYSFIDKHVGSKAPAPNNGKPSTSGGHHSSLHSGEEVFEDVDYSNVKPKDTYAMKLLFIGLLCAFPFVMNRWIRNDRLQKAAGQ